MLPLPDLKSGPGPLFFVTSWFTESSFVQVTVAPLLTVRVFGSNAMFFIDTLAEDPPAAGAELEVLLELPPPPPPHPATTNVTTPTARKRFTPDTLDHTSNSSSAFCACSRFSAWSNTADCGPYSAPSLISSPTWAGRQWSTIAS